MLISIQNKLKPDRLTSFLYLQPVPATGTGKTGTSSGLNRLPEDSTHCPDYGSRQPVPVVGIGNRSVCSRLKRL